MWFLHRFAPESDAYNIPLALRLDGHLRRDVAAHALTEIVRRHEVLRTVIVEADEDVRRGGPQDAVRHPVWPPSTVHEPRTIRICTMSGRRASVWNPGLKPGGAFPHPGRPRRVPDGILRTAPTKTSRIEGASVGLVGDGPAPTRPSAGTLRPPPLRSHRPAGGAPRGGDRNASPPRRRAGRSTWRRGPVLRALLVRLAERRHAAAITLHHIATDGWSMGILVREFSALYRAFALGEPSPLAELPVQYADYAVWQRRWLAGPALEQQLDWWRRRLGVDPPPLDLPADRPRSRDAPGAERCGASPWRRGSPSGSTVSAGERSASLFMTLLAAWTGAARPPLGAGGRSGWARRSPTAGSSRSKS